MEMEKRVILSKSDADQYHRFFKQIKTKRVPLSHANIKNIIKQQFPVEEDDAEYIINKAFMLTSQPKYLHEDGFYICLKIIQCQQNGINIRQLKDDDFYDIKLTQKLTLRVKDAKNTQIIKNLLPQQIEVDQDLDSEDCLAQSQGYLTQIQESMDELLSKTVQGSKGQVKRGNTNPIQNHHEENHQIKKVPLKSEAQSSYQIVKDDRNIDMNDLEGFKGETLPLNKQDKQSNNDPIDVEEPPLLLKKQDQQLINGPVEVKELLNQNFQVKNDPTDFKESPQINVQQIINPNNNQKDLPQLKQQQIINNQIDMDDDDDTVFIGMDGDTTENNRILEQQEAHSNYKNHQKKSDEIDINSNNNSEYRKISVKSCGYVKESILSGYYQYKISTTLGEGKDKEASKKVEEVDRRYSDFQMLYDYLRSAYMSFIVPVLPDKESYMQNVSKKFFVQNDQLEERRACLENYLKQLITEPKVQGDKILKKFLTDRQKFEMILSEFRDNNSALQDLLGDLDFQDQDEIKEIVPNPQNYLFTSIIVQSIKNLQEVNMNDLYTIFSSKNEEINSTFQKDYKQTKIYKTDLENRLQELNSFQGQVEKFFNKVDLSSIQSAKCQNKYVIDQPLIDQGEKAISRYLNYINKEQTNKNYLLQRISVIKQILKSVVKSYNSMQQEIQKWDRKRQNPQVTITEYFKMFQKIRDTQKSQNQLIKEEQRLLKQIEGLNVSLRKIVESYADRLQELLLQFNQIMINTMKDIYEQ